jgi:SPP1 family predicted phage head-tail adaptor
MPFNPGRLDRRLAIQARTSTRDDQGSPLVAFATERTVWAEKVEMNSSEARSAGALRAETTLLLRIRYLSSLTSQHRLYFEGKYYDVNGDPIEDTSQGRREAMFVQGKYTEGADA